MIAVIDRPRSLHQTALAPSGGLPASVEPHVCSDAHGTTDRALAGLAQVAGRVSGCWHCGGQHSSARDCNVRCFGVWKRPRERCVRLRVCWRVCGRASTIIAQHVAKRVRSCVCRVLVRARCSQRCRAFPPPCALCRVRRRKRGPWRLGPTHSCGVRPAPARAPASAFAAEQSIRQLAARIAQLAAAAAFPPRAPSATCGGASVAIWQLGATPQSYGVRPAPPPKGAGGLALCVRKKRASFRIPESQKMVI